MKKNLAVLSHSRTSATIGQGALAEAAGACGGELKIQIEDPLREGASDDEMVLRWIDSIYEEGGTVYVRLQPRPSR
jgi:hypothetical protein